MNRKIPTKKIPIFQLDTKHRMIPDQRILEMKELLRPDEVADILRISRRLVYEMMETGELECIRIRKGGRSLRVLSRSVKEILSADAEVL